MYIDKINNKLITSIKLEAKKVEIELKYSDMY